jgi:hypothetical protein
MWKMLPSSLFEEVSRRPARGSAGLTLALLLALGSAQACGADVFIIAPDPYGTVGGSNETGTIYPFLVKQIQALPNPPPVPTIRYQQVYNSSLFTNVDPQIIYVTSLRFYGYFPSPPSAWGVPNMQINLSTTTNGADHLSPVFAENVGADDTVVFGPASYSFLALGSFGVFTFSRPFRFHPPLGNLLLDVRIFDGRGELDPVNPNPLLDAYNSPTDEVSRVWATNVTATTANGSDTVGLDTVIGLSPVPSLKSRFYPSYASGTLTNIIQISWPSQPTNFLLQSRDTLALGGSWQPATNQVLGGPLPGGVWFIELQASNAGPARFYRLVWPSGQ